MDELDQLLTAKQDVVYNFFNWPTLRDSQLFVIAIANRMDLPQHLAAKVKSRLGECQTPYDENVADLEVHFHRSAKLAVPALRQTCTRRDRSVSIDSPP